LIKKIEMPLACRYYENEFPELEDTVKVKVIDIAEMGAYVTLTEYNEKGNSSQSSIY